jgi:putative endopeptidase
VAFQKTEQYKKNIMIGGFTPAQRFFLGYALAWMVNQRPETIATQVKSNEHAPAKFRVNGPLSDMPEFYEAFNVKQGDAMWLPDSLRVSIW